MFHPSPSPPCYSEYQSKHEYLAPYQIIRPTNNRDGCDDQVAIARLTSSSGIPSSGAIAQRCLLISHGNAGNIFDRTGLLDSLAHYPGDIYCYEYDGFGLLSHKSVSIPACRSNHLFWLEYLIGQGYQQIDLWGESIGGGIVMETLDYLSQNDFSTHQEDMILPRIQQVYLQSTFSSIRNLLSKMSSALFFMYSALFLNDLDTQSTLAKFRGAPICFNILHSRTDEIIPYSESLHNYAECIKKRVSAKFWNLGGTHNQVNGLDTIRF